MWKLSDRQNVDNQHLYMHQKAVIKVMQEYSEERNMGREASQGCWLLIKEWSGPPRGGAKGQFAPGPELQGGPRGQDRTGRRKSAICPGLQASGDRTNGKTHNP